MKDDNGKAAGSSGAGVMTIRVSETHRPSVAVKTACKIALVLAFTAILPGSAGGQALRLGASAPDVAGGPWIGSTPLTIAGLRGRVVLVEFWTHG